ncbi:hypothetical protein WUBG_16980, partial [Wuchereria bancrofti]
VNRFFQTILKVASLCFGANASYGGIGCSNGKDTERASDVELMEANRIDMNLRINL